MRTLAQLIGAAARGWYDDDVPRLGASLAYYTLFAIAPVLLVALAVAGLTLGAEAARGEIFGQVRGLVGNDAALAVQALVDGASRQESGVGALALGAVTFFLAASGAFLELQYALNRIFRVQLPTETPWSEFVAVRFRSFGLALITGLLLLISVCLGAILTTLSVTSHPAMQEAAWLWRVAHFGGSLAAIAALFACIYRYLPDVRLSWRQVGSAAVVTALLFMLGMQLISLYLARGIASSFGAAGSVMVLLLWVYYSTQVVLFGAELTRAFVGRDERAGLAKPAQCAEAQP